MARLVKHEATGPQEVNGAHICMCGLSKSKPKCDGSHHKTRDEQGRLYVYHEDKRVEV